MKRLFVSLIIAAASLSSLADLISSDGPFTFIKVPTNVTEQATSEYTPGSDDWYIQTTNDVYVGRTPRLDDTMLASFASTFDGFFEHLYYPTLSDTTNRWDAALYGPQNIPYRFWWYQPTPTNGVSYINILDYRPLTYNYGKNVTRRFTLGDNFKKLSNALTTLVQEGGKGRHAFPYRPYYCNADPNNPRLFWSTTGKLPYNPSYSQTPEVFPEFNWTTNPTAIQFDWPTACWTFDSFTDNPVAIAKNALAYVAQGDTNTLARVQALPNPLTFGGTYDFFPLDYMINENFPHVIDPDAEDYNHYTIYPTRRLTFDDIAYMNATIALLDRTIYTPEIATFPKYITHNYTHRKTQQGPCSIYASKNYSDTSYQIYVDYQSVNWGPATEYEHTTANTNDYGFTCFRYRRDSSFTTGYYSASGDNETGCNITVNMIKSEIEGNFQNETVQVYFDKGSGIYFPYSTTALVLKPEIYGITSERLIQPQISVGMPSSLTIPRATAYRSIERKLSWMNTGAWSNWINGPYPPASAAKSRVDSGKLYYVESYGYAQTYGPISSDIINFSDPTFLYRCSAKTLTQYDDPLALTYSEWMDFIDEFVPPSDIHLPIGTLDDVTDKGPMPGAGYPAYTDKLIGYGDFDSCVLCFDVDANGHCTNMHDCYFHKSGHNATPITSGNEVVAHLSLDFSAEGSKSGPEIGYPYEDEIKPYSADAYMSIIEKIDWNFNCIKRTTSN